MAQHSVAALSETAGAIAAQTEVFERRTVDIRLKLSTLNAKMENVHNTLRRLKEFQKDGIKRLEQLLRDIQLKTQKKKEAEDHIAERQTRLSGMYEEMARVESALERDEADFQEIETMLGESGRSISQAQTAREAVLQKIRLMELEQFQRQIKRENLENRVMERYHRPLAAFRSELRGVDYGREMSAKEMQAELEQIRVKLDGLGNVHLGAISEYEQLKERYDFLCGQRDDLIKAVEDLHHVIRKINQISQERFLATFDQINEKLGQVFPGLFGGGSARLVLSSRTLLWNRGWSSWFIRPAKS